MKQLMHFTAAEYKYGHFFSEEFLAKPVSCPTWWRAELDNKLNKPMIVGTVREMEDGDTISVLLLLKENLR